jgi:DNA invertase Pin-like site-specific DNA recombinase
LAGQWRTTTSIKRTARGEGSMISNPRKAAIYSRYSSDLQRDRSISDQVDHCRQLADRHGCRVVEVYRDHAKSGASMFERDGLLALMQAAKERKFEVVITESLSRLSRDQEDTAAIYKRLRFNEIAIIDSNGEVGDVHVGVGGIVNSMFLKNLAQAVKRGRNGRVREGLVPGRVAYGYRAIPGKPGEREIDPEQAKVVLKIFTMYADGVTARDICKQLKAEGIASPSGMPTWNHQKLITGSGAGGLLGNQLYRGRLTWNNSYRIKNPENGKRTRRKAPEADRIEVDVEHLRIVEESLWDRAQDMREARRTVKEKGGARVYKYGDKSRFLLGLLRCAVCGGSMITGMSNRAGSARVVCSDGYRRVKCTHTKSYDLRALESTVLDGIKDNLANRKALVEFTREYHGRWQERQKEIRVDRDAVQKALNRVTIKIDRIVAAIASEDGGAVEELVAALKPLRVEKAGLTERLKVVDAESNVVTLHPKAIDEFATTMEKMHAALSGKLDAERLAPFHMAFQSVFERIVVHPTPKRAQYAVTPYARLGAIMGVDLFPKMETVEQMLAAQGVPPISIPSPSGR